MVHRSHGIVIGFLVWGTCAAFTTGQDNTGAWARKKPAWVLFTER